MGGRFSALESFLDSDLRKIMGLWSDSCVDPVYGGYLTCRNRDFSLYDDKKGAWGQARHIFTYSMMAEYDVKNRDYWLHLADVGIDFVLSKMFCNKTMRTNYLVSRSGDVLEGPTSVFSDAFLILGLAKYIQASGDGRYKKLLDDMFGTYQVNIRNPRFEDIAPNPYAYGVYHHAIFMISTNVSYEVSKVFGLEHVKDFMRYCLDVIFNVLVDDRSGCIFEKKNSGGSLVDASDRSFVNIGHTFESLWFALDCDALLGGMYFNKILSIAEATYEIGTDDGLIMFSKLLDDTGASYKTWKYEIAFEPGDRVSWSYAESMVLFFYLHYLTGDDRWLERFYRHFDYVKDNFLDKVYGDWFHALDSNGNVKIDMKGSTVKDAYHIPRAYVKIIELIRKTDMEV